MPRYTDIDNLIAEYDRVHVGPAGGARKLMTEAPIADVVPRAEVAKIFEEIERLLDNYHSACLPVGAIEPYTYYEGDLGEAFADLKKKYTEEQK
jgi:hypothetical protein